MTQAVLIFFMSNSSRSFQNTMAVTIGLSNCHKMLVTLPKKYFQKSKPKKVILKSYKDLNSFSTSAPLMRKPDSWFLLARCLKNTCGRVTF